jgi:hypothetical protein
MIYQFFYRITPYWVAHAVISVVISLITGYWLSGAIFYAGREIAQYEEKKYFDWKGFLAPLVVSIILLIIKTGKA